SATGERTVRVAPKGARVVDPPRELAARHVHEVIDDVRLRVSAGSFFQTRPDGAQALVDAVRAAAGPIGRDESGVDAYAGVGLFGATVGSDASVTAIERSPSSCRDARHNLGERATVVQLDVSRWRATRAEVVIADPSRDGLGRRAVDVLAAAGA